MGKHSTAQMQASICASIERAEIKGKMGNNGMPDKKQPPLQPGARPSVPGYFREVKRIFASF
jgi:hypothetical protein